METQQKERIILLTEDEYRALKQVIWMAEAHIDEWKMGVMRQRAIVKVVRGICKKFRQAKTK